LGVERPAVFENIRKFLTYILAHPAFLNHVDDAGEIIVARE
jgi:hypothetical protein